MQRRACVPSAPAVASVPPVVLIVLLSAPAIGCSQRNAPEDAPSLATTTTIPTAAPNAIGVNFESPKPYIAPARRPSPDDAPKPLPTVTPEAPAPLPGEAIPSPFGQPPGPEAPGPEAPGKQPEAPGRQKDGGAATGPLPKGVQL